MLELKDYTINDFKTIFGTRKRDNKSYVDIWKEKYNEETAEEPDLVEGNIQKLVDIVNKYLYSSTN